MNMLTRSSQWILNPMRYAGIIYLTVGNVKLYWIGSPGSGKVGIYAATASLRVKLDSCPSTVSKEGLKDFSRWDSSP